MPMQYMNYEFYCKIFKLQFTIIIFNIKFLQVRYCLRDIIFKNSIPIKYQQKTLISLEQVGMSYIQERN